MFLPSRESRESEEGDIIDINVVVAHIKALTRAFRVVVARSRSSTRVKKVLKAPLLHESFSELTEGDEKVTNVTVRHPIVLRT